MANQRITELTALTDPVDADLSVAVDDVAGTPITKKITLAVLKTFFRNLLAIPAADVTADGLKVDLVAAENLVFGEVCYINSAGKLAKADADAIATSSAFFMALASISTDATGSFLALGFARNDAWTWTVGGLIYLSTTPGALTQTAPSGTDDVIQILGVATHADRMIFRPNLVQVEHT